MKRSLDKVGRISALPESVIHHIMSFLSLKEVVQASKLCKTWNEAWFTFPNLEFSYDRSSDLITKGMLKCLGNILLRRHLELISIKKVTLRFWLVDPEIKRLIDQCLCHAFGSNVEELKLFVTPGRRYSVPQIVFSAQSLNVLELSFCRLFWPRISVKLSLRKLCLSHVSANDYTIHSLIAGCPSIEYLSLDYCSGFKSLELFNHGKLKFIKVKDSFDLKKLNINELNAHSVIIKEIIMFEINIASCKNVKCLELFLLPIMDDWLCNVISKLLFLVKLSISDCLSLQRIKISGPCLEQLYILRCSLLVEVKIETPNLSIFRYMGKKIPISSTVLALSTDLYIDYDIDDPVKYGKHRAKFQSSTGVLNLSSSLHRNNEIEIIPSELRQMLHPLLSSVKHLNFLVDKNFIKFSITKLVDRLLWMLPHIETASVECGYDCQNKFSFQFTYKKKLNYEGEIFLCCQSLPVQCWQNCIEKVEIKHAKQYSKDIVGVKSYSFLGEKIVEKIDDVYANLVEQNLL